MSKEGALLLTLQELIQCMVSVTHYKYCTAAIHIPPKILIGQ